MNFGKKLAAAIEKAGVRVAASVPDNWIEPVIERLDASATVIHTPAAREEDALGICLGAALAHPNRKVVVIEGDGGLLMGLTSLASVAHRQPPNLLLICMDNGVYEAGGMGATVNAGRTDFVKIVQGLGIGQAISTGDSETLRETVKELLTRDACAFLHVPIGVRKGKLKPALFQPAEIKCRFQAALKAKSP